MSFPQRSVLLFSLCLGFAVSLSAQTSTSSPTDEDRMISIFFGGGSYYIDGVQAQRLREFLDEIPALEGYEIEVQGHTDDIGNRAYNLRLSEFRARAVIDLLHQYPIPPEIIDMVPLGEDAPSFDNATWNGKLNNRRVDVILKRVLF
ncbi:OmpA family protein [Lewinella sp. W8]|uniref:OmpA family protein n=1 Tax=Lewinella sp. W8 TaxID=2528208 RepID=UPI001067AD6A|nr:OmpA family protein [Lewinella sp. W8]MTB51482.1 OmpA family protein [Lewinella sp. W8]